MQPSTIHLFAQVIRHNRGIVNAFEKWARSQPPSETCDELLRIILMQRQVLQLCERQLELEPPDISDGDPAAVCVRCGA